MNTTDDSSGPPPDAATLLDEVAARVVSTMPADAFVAWFAAEAASIAPGFDAWLRARGDGALDGGFARALWNRLPRPDERLHARPLPPVGRNDPCPCGSGEKHKRCCLDTGPSVETLARLPLLLHVLDALPDRTLETLDFSGADPDALLETLDLWGAEGAGGARRATRRAAVRARGPSAQARPGAARGAARSLAGGVPRRRVRRAERAAGRTPRRGARERRGARPRPGGESRAGPSAPDRCWTPPGAAFPSPRSSRRRRSTS